MIRMLLLVFVLRGFLMVLCDVMRRVCDKKLADADSPHRWCRTLKESVFGVEQSVPPLVDPASWLSVSESDRKAELSMSTFEAKQSSSILELPPTALC